MKLKKDLSVAFLATAILSIAAPAIAQDGWTGEASLSGSRTTGNTDTTDLGLALKLERDTETWGHSLYGTIDFGRVDGEQNKERYTVGYQLDRNLTERLYVFGNGDYYRDEFGAFDEGYYLGAGVGYKLVLPAPLGWDIEGGAGFRSQNPRTPDVPEELTEAELAILEATGDLDRQNEFGLRGASKLTYDFNDNVSLYNNSEVTWTSSDTYLWNEIGITANLFGNLAARASYRVDHHTDPIIGENTDTISRVGVVYTIK